MKSKSLPAVLATVIVVIAAWYISHIRAPETEVGTPPLFPDLAARVNDVKRVEIESRSGKTMLAGDGTVWTIENRDGYPARFEDVKRAIVALSVIKIIEPKTRLPEMYSNIGVEDISAEDSNSTQVTLKDGAGQTIVALIVGKERTSSTGPASAARYVRKAGEPQSYLIEGELNVSTDALNWTDRNLLSIPAVRIREVRFDYVGKQPVRISRQKAADTELTLDSVPIGYRVKSTSSVTSLASVLEDLRFDDVRSAANVQWPADHTTTTLLGFDGMIATVRTATIDARKYSKLDFAFDPAAVTSEAANIAKEAEIPELPIPGADKKDATPTEEKTVSVADEVKSLNERVAGWVYVLPDYKQTMLTRTLEDLIAKQETPKPAAPIAPPVDPLTVEHFDEQGRPIPAPAAAPIQPAPDAMLLPPGGAAGVAPADTADNPAGNGNSDATATPAAEPEVPSAP